MPIQNGCKRGSNCCCIQLQVSSLLGNEIGEALDTAAKDLHWEFGEFSKQDIYNQDDHGCLNKAILSFIGYKMEFKGLEECGRLIDLNAMINSLGDKYKEKLLDEGIVWSFLNENYKLKKWEKVHLLLSQLIKGEDNQLPGLNNQAEDWPIYVSIKTRDSNRHAFGIYDAMIFEAIQTRPVALNDHNLKSAANEDLDAHVDAIYYFEKCNKANNDPNGKKKKEKKKKKKQRYEARKAFCCCWQK